MRNDDARRPVCERYITCSVALVALSCMAIRSHAQRGGAAEVLPYSIPMAVTAGQSTTVDFHVAGKASSGFWATFPAQATVKEGKEADVARVLLELPASVPVGVGAARFMSGAGVSDLRLLFIDDIPTTARAENNLSPKEAQSLILPAAVEAEMPTLGMHYYRFAAKKGERIAFEVVAQRMNSRADPIVRIHNTAGREIAYCDDTPGLGADPRFAHVFKADGEYLAEVRDANYDGGPECRYRLRIGDFPTATVPFPLGGKRGSITAFAFEGPDGDRLDPLKVKLDTTASLQLVALKSPGGRSSSFASILVGDTEDFVTSQPNHSPAASARVELPANISGRLTAPGICNFYRFTGKKGDRLSLRARTRSVASPAMLVMRILKKDGAKLAESKFAIPESKTGDANPIPDEEGSLDVTLPSDGDYDIVAQDLTGASGPGAVYRLEARKLRPDFTLSVDTDKLNGNSGATVHLKVKATRRDLDVPILLSLTDDAASFALKNQTISKGKAETDLEIALPKDLPANPLCSFTIQGRAILAGREIVHTASTAAPLKKLFPRLPSPPLQLDGLIGLGILPPQKPSTAPTTRPAK